MGVSLSEDFPRMGWVDVRVVVLGPWKVLAFCNAFCIVLATEELL